MTTPTTTTSPSTPRPTTAVTPLLLARTRRTGSAAYHLPAWYDEHHMRAHAAEFLSRIEVETTIRRYLEVKASSEPLRHTPAGQLARAQWQEMWDADDELNRLYRRLGRACALIYLPDGNRPGHLDHLAEAYRTGKILPGPRQPAPMPGGLLAEHHSSLGSALKPLSRIREGERLEATVTITAIQRFSGVVRLLMESYDGQSAHARVPASCLAAAEEAIGRSFKVGDEVRVHGYAEQEPALRTGIKSVDVCSIRAGA